MFYSVMALELRRVEVELLEEPSRGAPPKGFPIQFYKFPSPK
jgi:hypothetical protein